MPRMTKGGFERWLVAPVVLACLAACTHAVDMAAICSGELGENRDAVAACTDAYVATPSTQTAEQLVDAVAARGEQALTELLALHPIDYIGAEIWHHRARRLAAKADPVATVAAFERALALRGGDLAGQVRELEGLSTQYEVLGDQRRALVIEARAVDAAAKLGDPTLRAHVNVELAAELELVGDAGGAIRALGDIATELPVGDRYLATALIMQGDYYNTHGRPLLARALFLRVLRLGDEDAARDAQHNLIEVALNLGDTAEASRLIASDRVTTDTGHAYYEARVALARDRPDEASHWIDVAFAHKPMAPLIPMLETMRGQALEKRGHEAAAVAAFVRAMNAFEAQLDDLGIDELKAFAQRDSDRRAPYEELFTLHAHAGRALEAFAITQRAMGRAYLDGLTASDDERSLDVPGIARTAGTRAEALHVIARSLRASAPAHLPDLATLVAHLADEVVWTYFVADGRVWLVALDHGVASVDDLGTVAALRPLIEQASSLAEPALAELGEQLAPPRRWARITPATIVHVVVGSPLDRIPFAALGPEGERWIQRAAIAYVPSATVLMELSRARHGDASVVAIGDPLGNLPGARREAIATASTFGVAARLGANATVASVLAASHAGLLAVATHAEATPGGARLRLADGDVTAADLIDHHVAPQLAVLASCESAAVDTDAWGALAGAFMAAGTPNVIAARWALEDRLTRPIIERFYSADGVGHPALALAIAQREAIKQAIPVSAWAALVSLGTGEGTSRN